MLLMVSKEFRDRRDRRTSPPKADRQARGMGDKRNEISYGESGCDSKSRPDLQALTSGRY